MQSTYTMLLSHSIQYVEESKWRQFGSKLVLKIYRDCMRALRLGTGRKQRLLKRFHVVKSKWAADTSPGTVGHIYRVGVPRRSALATHDAIDALSVTD